DRRPLLAAGDLAEVVDVEILKLLLAVVLAHDCSALVASMGSARGRRGRRCLEHRRHRTFPGTEAHQANTACPAAKYRLGRHEALAPAPGRGGERDQSRDGCLAAAAKWLPKCSELKMRESMW